MPLKAITRNDNMRLNDLKCCTANTESQASTGSGVLRRDGCAADSAVCLTFDYLQPTALQYKAKANNYQPGTKGSRVERDRKRKKKGREKVK